MPSVLSASDTIEQTGDMEREIAAELHYEEEDDVHKKRERVWNTLADLLQQEADPLERSAVTKALLQQQNKRGKKQNVMSDTPVRNVWEYILRYGHDKDYEPQTSKDFKPTDAEPGSPEKIEVLRRRVEKGQPLWHPLDAWDYS